MTSARVLQHVHGVCFYYKRVGQQQVSKRHVRMRAVSDEDQIFVRHRSANEKAYTLTRVTDG